MKRVKYTDLPPADPRILQEMLALCTPPGTKGTEKAFLQGRDDLATMPPNSRRKWLHMSKQQGISLAGKVHMSGISDGLDSWVSNFDEGLERLKQRGDRTVYRHGEVVYAPPEKEPEPDIPLAADLVNEAVRDMVKADPSLRKKKLPELKAMAIEKHGPQKAS